MAYATDAPLLYYLIAPPERAEKATLSDDDCIIYGRRYFIRGVIPLRVEEEEQRFYWGVWVEVDKDVFDHIGASCEDENSMLQGPFTGTLATQLEPYPQTNGLLVTIAMREQGYVPDIILQKSDHPLFLEQESRINKDRLIAFAKRIVYKHLQSADK